MDLAAAQYYAAHYPHGPVLELLARRWRGSDLLACRELCIETVDDVYIRWLSAQTAAELKQLFREKRVLKFHSGGVYAQTLAEKQRNKQLPMAALQRELLFEIDANDYEFAGVDASDIAACDAAWPLIAFGMLVVQYILIEHFGFKHILIVYSGRRGAHLSVHDERACRLTDDERKAIVAYLQPPKGDPSSDGTHRNFGNILSGAFFGELWAKTVRPFWVEHCLKPRVGGGMGLLDSQSDRNDFVDLFSASDYVQERVHAVMKGCACGADAFAAMERWVEASRYAESNRYHLRSAVLAHVWFPLDANVSTGRGHLGKHPFSVHPKTGRLCVPTGSDPSAFDPATDAPTLQGVVDGAAADADALAKGVKRLQRFAARLAKDPAETTRCAPPPSIVYAPPPPPPPAPGSRKRPRPYYPDVDRWGEAAARAGPYGLAGFAHAR